MSTRLLATMVTTTSYGAWLPGDLRGYLDQGVILPGDPDVFHQAVRNMGGRMPVRFTIDQQVTLFGALCAGAVEFGYELTDVSIE